MNRLERYIARQVFAAMALVLLVLGGLDLLLSTIDELGDTKYGYGAAQALLYMLYTAPRHIYELLPASALIGALAGLGSLAATNELVGMQAAGMSRWQIARAVMQPTLLVMLLGLALGEFAAPQLGWRAEVNKTLALGVGVGQTRYGHWERDGHNFFHFNTIEPDGVLHTVVLFEFDDKQRLLHQLEAENAVYQGPVAGSDSRHHWQLVNGNVLGFDYREGETVNTHETFTAKDWELDLTPDLLQNVVVDPADMAISDLWRFAGRFQQQGLESGPYFLGFWRKALQPINTAALVMMAISFIFGPLRSSSMGSRVFIAISLGLVVTIVQKLLQNLSLVYHLPPLSAVVLPITLCLLAGMVLLQRRV
ncbi:MAG TPA: LPS export ABC transporter permease LptG [Candidatus Acidoferrum sp.]|nr:LPS export ABC transporter permease LptG [Candidatus Acidoferrum sp.]